jgi:hypothetical protein
MYRIVGLRYVDSELTSSLPLHLNPTKIHQARGVSNSPASWVPGKWLEIRFAVTLPSATTTATASTTTNAHGLARKSSKSGEADEAEKVETTAISASNAGEITIMASVNGEQLCMLKTAYGGGSAAKGGTFLGCGVHYTQFDDFAVTLS